MTDTPLATIGPYALREQIGRGGMGTVHRATAEDGTEVAVKVMHGDAADLADPERLAREVATMRRVRSPYVAEVIGADTAGDPPYVVTRFVPGPTLAARVAAAGPLTGEPLLSLARGLAAALEAMHDADVVHRDLKPGNVILGEDGDPVVIDFGIARAMDATRLTRTGVLLGTPGYLAPECVRGQEAGPAADVFGYGATLAFAATGRPPFGDGALEAVIYAVMEGRADLNGLPAGLTETVRRCLHGDPAARPSAAGLHTAAHRLSAADLDRTVRLAPPAPTKVLDDDPPATRATSAAPPATAAIAEEPRPARTADDAPARSRREEDVVAEPAEPRYKTHAARRRAERLRRRRERGPRRAGSRGTVWAVALLVAVLASFAAWVFISPFAVIFIWGVVVILAIATLVVAG
ncbi:MAG: protein kinase [Streptosporangiales bacterium]|nr:protein kinase [Streptosporangiales bacterium]